MKSLVGATAGGAKDTLPGDGETPKISENHTASRLKQVSPIPPDVLVLIPGACELILLPCKGLCKSD